MKYRLTLLLLASFIYIISPLLSNAQVTAPPQQGKIFITGATIHAGDGTIIENGNIAFENGVITYVGKDNTAPSGATTINASGKHIYPGIIALGTYLGMIETEAIRATNDVVEVGNYNPNVRAIIAYNTDSKVIPTVRSNGVLYAQIAPQGGRVSGTSAVVQLDAWNWEDAAVNVNEGICMNWPSLLKVKDWSAQPRTFELNKDYDKQLTALKNYFKEAAAYATNKTNEPTNIRFEAMRGLFNGSQPLYVSTDYVKEMLHAIQFGEDLGIKIVLVGAHDSYLIADELAKKKIPVILGKTHQLPIYADEAIDQPYSTPAILQKAGVLYAISIGAFWQERNLAFEAGTACAFGLSKEEALTAITKNAATILGLDNKIGSLVVGKQASLIISTGDVLNMSTSIIEQAYIDGRKIDLGNKQKDLYQKYMDKYGLK